MEDPPAQWTTYPFNRESKITDIPLHTTDKRVAQQHMERIAQEKQLESLGIIPLEAIRAASQASRDKHLADYITDLELVGQNGASG